MNDEDSSPSLHAGARASADVGTCAAGGSGSAAADFSGLAR
jgi:hypothetical protein